MSNDELQILISARKREINELNEEIEQLKIEMDQVLDAEIEVRRADGAFTDYIECEKTLSERMISTERVRAAVGFGIRMNKALAGAKYRSAASGVDSIKKAIEKRKLDIEKRIEQCRRKISSLQDLVLSLNQRLSQADGR